MMMLEITTIGNAAEVDNLNLEGDAWTDSSYF